MTRVGSMTIGNCDGVLRGRIESGDSMEACVGETVYKKAICEVSSSKESGLFRDVHANDYDRTSKLKSSCFGSTRFYIIMIALLSPLVVTFSKQFINFVILDMVDPELHKKNTSNNETTPYWETDGSCPVDEIDRQRLIEELNQSHKNERRGVGGSFRWGSKVQGFIKASYAVGHMPMQILGGRMAEIHGSHRVMIISSLMIAICCALGPLLANIHYFCLMVDLAIIGLFGGFMTPALINLFSNWLTPNEKSVTMTLYLATSRLGSALSSIICEFLSGMDLHWSNIFFVSSAFSLSFCLFFSLFARSRPIECNWIDENELNYLASKNRLVRDSIQDKKIHDDENKTNLELSDIGSGGTTNDDNNNGESSQVKKHVEQRARAAPWRSILTNIHVWAFVTTKFCVKFAGDMAEKELPNYLSRVMHVSKVINGTINATNYIIFAIGCFFSGIIARWAIKRRPFNISKTVCRKIFQAIGSFGVSISLYGVALNVCNRKATAFFFGSMFLLTTLGAGGESQMPLDLSERYSGTLHALASSICASTGWAAPIFVGQLNSDGKNDTVRWAWIWTLAASISALGGVVFVFFSDAKPQPFDQFQVELEVDIETGKEEQEQEEQEEEEEKAGDRHAKDVKEPQRKLSNDNSNDELEPGNYKESRVI